MVVVIKTKSEPEGMGVIFLKKGKTRSQKGKIKEKNACLYEIWLKECMEYFLTLFEKDTHLDTIIAPKKVYNRPCKLSPVAEL